MHQLQYIHGLVWAKARPTFWPGDPGLVTLSWLNFQSCLILVPNWLSNGRILNPLGYLYCLTFYDPNTKYNIFLHEICMWSSGESISGTHACLASGNVLVNFRGYPKTLLIYWGEYIGKKSGKTCRLYATQLIYYNSILNKILWWKLCRIGLLAARGPQDGGLPLWE